MTAKARRARARAGRAGPAMSRVVALAAGLAAAVPGRSGAQPRPAPVTVAPAAHAPAAGPLDGATYDYAHPSAPAHAAARDEAAGAGAAADAGVAARPVPPEQRWMGRVFVHRLAAAAPARPRPILVFLHGTNAEQIRYRWMGGGREGDVRRIAAELMEAGRIPPILVAGPSAILPAAIAAPRTSWPAFDLDTFLDATAARLRGVATIDRTRVLVAGHSGGGCNEAGGVVTALRASTPVHAALVIDTCMDADIALPLALSPPTTHVVVSWQTMTWARRPLGAFRRAFQAAVEAHPAAPGVLRELEHLRPTEPMPHDAMVPLVLRRWLPPLLSPDAAPSIPCVSP
ncbi:hypothetical protein WMF31_39130 [Sorangium sp. So ce1036]|uniref:hypothetical protein n=1 Tax=Sorangium sp. So ce1036 TaxID=3133328 RepID=UPI003F0CC344